MNSTSNHYKETTSQKDTKSGIHQKKDNMLTSKANIFLHFFLFLELGDFRQTTTKKPKTKKQSFETEFLVSRIFFGGGSLEFCFLLVSSKGCLVFWFWMLKNQKSRVFFCFWNWFWKLASSRNQKNSSFSVFQHPKPKKQTPFRGNQKKTKKLEGNQKTKLFPESKNNVSKDRFLVFGFLVVVCLKSPNSKNQKNSRNMLVWEVSKLQKPTRLIEQIVVFDTIALFMQNTYKKR